MVKKDDLATRIYKMANRIWLAEDGGEEVEAMMARHTTRDQIAIAMALDRYDLLPTGCTMLEAFDSIGAKWTRAALAAQRRRTKPKPLERYLVKGWGGKELVITRLDIVQFVDVVPGTLASMAAGVGGVILPRRSGMVLRASPVSNEGYVDTVFVLCDIEGKDWTIGVAASNILSVESDRPT